MITSQPFATIEGVIHNAQDKTSPPLMVSLSLSVHYDQKVAQIDLPATSPLFAAEPLTEVAARSLWDLIGALQEVAKTPARIYSQARRRT